ncbi:MAG: adenylate kinase [Nanoarchaeota archaeon]|nr:adenylate kinase [Nanoarchaeota archaeon]MBU1854447.1 adenylate kinase [Nanoarchaeota archaeon]
MKLIIFGAQASGKGTQAVKIAEKFGIPQISTGDILRDNINKNTDLGKKAQIIMNQGNLVSDEIVNNMVRERLKARDCKKGFILDGYPRTKAQTEFLETLPYKIDAVINLYVSKPELIKRISSRRVCANCKTNYNLIYIKPKKEGVCDKCNCKLVIRDDDKPEAIKKRLTIYHEQTEPLIEFYRKKGVLKTINGEEPIDKVFRNIIEKQS